MFVFYPLIREEPYKMASSWSQPYFYLLLGVAHQYMHTTLLGFLRSVIPFLVSFRHLDSLLLHFSIQAVLNYTCLSEVYHKAFITAALILPRLESFPPLPSPAHFLSPTVSFLPLLRVPQGSSRHASRLSARQLLFFKGNTSALGWLFSSYLPFQKYWNIKINPTVTVTQ